MESFSKASRYGNGFLEKGDLPVGSHTYGYDPIGMDFVTNLKSSYPWGPNGILSKGCSYEAPLLWEGVEGVRYVNSGYNPSVCSAYGEHFKHYGGKFVFHSEVRRFTLPVYWTGVCPIPYIEHMNGIVRTPDVPDFVDLYTQVMLQNTGSLLKCSESEPLLKPEDGLLQNIRTIYNGIDATATTVRQATAFLDTVQQFIDKVVEIVVGRDLDVSVTEALVSRLESLLILTYDLSTRETLGDCLAPMAQYVKTWSPTRSFSRMVINMLRGILTEDSSGNEGPGELTPNSGFFTTHWQQLVNGAFGKRFASALNLLILCGVVGAKPESQFTEEMFKIFSVQASRKTHPSIFHHLFSTLDWILDSVIPAFATKNYSLLLFDSDYAELDEMYRFSVDMVALNIAGQMDRVKEKYKIADEAEILVYLTQTTAAHSAMKKKCGTDPGMQRELNSRLLKLDRLVGDIQSFWHESGLRAAPYAVLIRGPSSIGKSTLASIVVHAISQANDFPEGKEYGVTVNPMDEYLSDYRSQHISIIFDDLGNTRPERCTTNPLFILIQFINNMHCHAMSPIAEEKGKKQIRAKIVVVTTNSDDLGANYFSVNPASIMRRFKLVVNATLKAEACDENGSLHPRYAGMSHPDVWDLQGCRVHIKRSTANPLVDTWQEIELWKGGVIELVEYLAKHSPEFYATQNRIVEAASELNKRTHCPQHPLFILPCPCCMRDALKGEGGLVDCATKVQRQWLDDNWVCGDGEVNTYADADPLLEEEMQGMSWRQSVQYIVDHKIAAARDFANSIKKTVKRNPLESALCAVAGLGLAGVAMWHHISPPRLRAEGATVQRIEMSAKTPVNLVERDNKYGKNYSDIVTDKSPEASTTCTLEQFERKVDANLFYVEYQEINPQTRETIGPLKWGNIFPYEGQKYISIGHFFQRGKTYQLTALKHPGTGIKRIKQIVDDYCIHRVEGEDLCLVELPGGGDAYHFSKYFRDDRDDVPVKVGDTVHVYHVFKDVARGTLENLPEGYLPPSKYKLTTTITDIKQYRVEGVGTSTLYSYAADTHDGMCGSMVVTATRNPMIIGVHCAGSKTTSSEKIGAAVPVDKKMFKWMELPDELVTYAETTDFPTHQLGVDFDVSREVHAFNPVHYLEADEFHNLEVLGQHDRPLNKFSSDVIESPLLPLMKEKMEYEPTHAAPPRKAARPSRRRHLKTVTQEQPNHVPKYLKAAVLDFKAKLEPLVSSELFREQVHTLSYEDAVSGVPGEHGFDCINPKTSMGWPLNSPKWKFFAKNDCYVDTIKFVSVEEIDGVLRYSYDIVFDEEKIDMVGEVEALATKFLEGIRANVVFRANLKDEPITFDKIAKDKIRVFAGAQTPFVILTRMMTLPLLNAMSCFPREFESAVGVDATGKEWQFMLDHLTSFGSGKNGDGDYKEFDMHIDSAFSTAAYEMIRWIFQECGYPEDLLKIWDGIATECIFPWYENDGLLFKALRSNPSGHTLTVIINGFVQSLYKRYAYYAMYDAMYGDIPLFHERVNLMTFGDDNNFEVHKDESRFNMMTIHDELKKIGVTYTDASKERPTTEYIRPEDMSFLKRKYTYHPRLGRVVGPLDKVSIYRSLALTRKPKANQKESVAQICAGNLSGALAELFYHSEEEYDTHLPIFTEMARECVDSEGHRVIDFFKPPTKDDLVERFNKTTCKYDVAAALLTECLQKQSGEGDVEVPERLLLALGDDVVLEAQHGHLSDERLLLREIQFAIEVQRSPDLLRVLEDGPYELMSIHEEVDINLIEFTQRVMNCLAVQPLSFGINSRLYHESLEAVAIYFMFHFGDDFFFSRDGYMCLRPTSVFTIKRSLGPLSASGLYIRGTHEAFGPDFRRLSNLQTLLELKRQMFKERWVFKAGVAAVIANAAEDIDGRAVLFSTCEIKVRKIFRSLRNKEIPILYPLPEDVQARILSFFDVEEYTTVPFSLQLDGRWVTRYAVTPLPLPSGQQTYPRGRSLMTNYFHGRLNRIYRPQFAADAAGEFILRKGL